jgi:cysteine desulfuration protein SufE
MDTEQKLCPGKTLWANTQVRPYDGTKTLNSQFSILNSQIAETINMLPDWQSRYNYLIEIGEQLPPMPEHLKRQANRIQSCASRTYFYIENPDCITVHGWSNSVIPAGFIALFKQLCDEFSLDEIRSNTIDFHIKTGLIDNLTNNRKEGFLEMLSKLK